MSTTLPSKPDPVIQAYKKHVDRTLLRENLRLTVQQRFENLMQLQRFAVSCRCRPIMKAEMTNSPNWSPLLQPRREPGVNSLPDSLALLW